MHQKFASLILVASVLVVGCAKKAESIAVTPISADKATKVATMNCEQIMQAMAFTDAKLARASGVQNAKASDDKLMVAGGVVLFLPLLFFTEGNKGAPNIGELKGIMEALEGQAILKKCKRPTAGLF
jgi:hypothetical protein